MIVADTNVVSEMIRPSASARVLSWFAVQPIDQVFLAATVLAELLLGVAIVPTGRRKQTLRNAIETVLAARFSSIVLPFDDAAARAYAVLVAQARSRGHTIAFADGQIAAIASVHSCTVATRDTAPFQAAGVPTINPWEAAA